MPDIELAQYLMPDRGTRGDKKLGWLKDAFAEGDAHLRSQRPYKDIASAMRVIAGEEADDIPPEMSKVYINRLKRQMREVVAVHSRINPTWYYSAADPKLEDQAQVMNKLLESWWSTTMADLRIRRAKQYAAGLGTAWVQPVWRKSYGRYGQGEVELDVHGPNSVRLLQPSEDQDLQKAYGVIITVETPINLARARYPESAHKLVPDRNEAHYSGQSRAMRLIEKLGGALGGSYVLKKYGAKKPIENKAGAYPTLDIHYLYLKDTSVNQTGKPVFMGKPGTTWHYRVPFLGEELPTNVTDPVSGKPAVRKADFEDCLIYPMRRLVIFTNTWVLYDDTATNWHGKVPLVRFVVDDWPWEMLGYGVLRDAEPIQKEINQTARGIGDRIQVALRPGLIFDENTFSQSDVKKIDPRKPGLRLRANLAGAGGRGVQSILEHQDLRIYPEHMAYLEYLADAMDHQMAVKDLTNLAKARQLPSDSTIDKIMEIAGPIVQDMSRVDEASMRDLGEMVGSNFIQYYDAGRRMSMVGEDGRKLEFWNFEPGSLRPELETGMTSYQKHERLREFSKQFRLLVAPGSLHEITQTQHKLMLFQLWRDPSFPLDPWTLAEAFGLKNFGIPPEGTGSMYDRHKAFMEDQTKFAAALQAQAQLITAMAMASMGGGASGASGASGAGGESPTGQQGPGRPPSGQAAPRLVQKDHGQRSTVTESR